jgi:hypothetical protein
MPDDRLSAYPYVVVRIGCDLCRRSGRYRLARLAEKYGAEITLKDLLLHLATDCPGVNPRHPYHRGCQARFIDLDPPQKPPDAPAPRLRAIAGGKQ